MKAKTFAVHTGRCRIRVMLMKGFPLATSAKTQTAQTASPPTTLKPYALTFAAYEALRLLAFTRSGSLPLGKMGERLMVHPAAVTNAITKLEQRGLVERNMSPDDRRVVLATITPAGHALADEATAALNQVAFGLPGFTQQEAADITAGSVNLTDLSHFRW